MSETKARANGAADLTKDALERALMAIRGDDLAITWIPGDDPIEVISVIGADFELTYAPERLNQKNAKAFASLHTRLEKLKSWSYTVHQDTERRITIRTAGGEAETPRSTEEAIALLEYTPVAIVEALIHAQEAIRAKEHEDSIALLEGRIGHIQRELHSIESTPAGRAVVKSVYYQGTHPWSPGKTLNEQELIAYKAELADTLIATKLQISELNDLLEADRLANRKKRMAVRKAAKARGEESQRGDV